MTGRRASRCIAFLAVALASAGCSRSAGPERVTDADGDTISDVAEGRASGRDTDGDGTPDYLDADSDDDGRADLVEAGDSDLATPPHDADADGAPDYVEVDSDADGALDADEDPDGDGVLAAGETDPLVPDTDGDGAIDLLETLAGTDPRDPASNPAAAGALVFVVPYEGAAAASGPVQYMTPSTKVDVFFLLDTTGSMVGELANLQASLGSIISNLAAQIPDIAFGLGDFRDFPVSPYGSTGDWPYRLRHRVMTAGTSAGLASLQSALNACSTGGGNDTPESSWEALYQVATGAGRSTPSYVIPSFNPAVTVPATVPAGEQVGTYPGVGWRSGAMPIVVPVTDAEGHQSSLFSSNYSGFTAATSSQAISSLQSSGARVIGVVSDSLDGPANARADLLQAVQGTGALVSPSAWGPAGTRPAACAEAQCCTGLGGAGETPNGSGLCPLSYLIASDGTGLGNAVVDGIEALATGIVLDVTGTAVDDPSDAVDAVAAFVDAVAATPSAGAPCAGGLVAVDYDGDGALDTFLDVAGESQTCFELVPAANTTVPATGSAQVYPAIVRMVGDHVTTLDERTVWFVVPAAP